MFNFLPWFVLFPINFLLHLSSVIFWGGTITTLGVVKFFLPLPFIRRGLNWLINLCFKGFALTGVFFINLTNKVHWDYKVDGELSPEGWYLMLSNHISQLDIVLLTHFTIGRIPATKFFLKKELLWVPFVGISAWAMDMPFMRRYSSAFVKKYPHLKGKDIESTRKACEKFKKIPTTIINFVEGTRFTSDKHQLRNSPYTHLLPPRAGGIAFALATMGEIFDKVIDITLCYPHSQHVMIDVLKGELTLVILHANVKDIEPELVGDYFNDESFRVKFQNWLNRLWQTKDKYITDLLGQR